MRSITQTLLANQQSASGTPYVRMAPSTNNIEFREYNTTATDDLAAVCMDSQDSDIMYVVGYTTAEGEGGDEAFIAKINKSDLSTNVDKIYGDTGSDRFIAVCESGDFVYAVGLTNSEGAGSNEFLIVKFKKSDLTISARKVYGGTGSDIAYGCDTDGTYLYVVGVTYSDGDGNERKPLILELNVSDLTINARKFGNRASGDYPYGIYYDVSTDGTNVFAVGFSRTATGDNVKLLVDKFAVNGLGSADIEVSGAYNDAIFYAMDMDTNFIYAAGFYRPTSSDARSGVICKIKKSDLSLDTGKKLDPAGGSTKTTAFDGIAVSGSHVYLTGTTNDEGEGGTDAIIAVLNKDDLSNEQTKMFGKTSSATNEGMGKCAVDGKHIFASDTGDVGTILYKFGINLQVTGTGGGYTVAAISTNTWAAFSPTMATATHVIGNSVQTLANSAMTLANSSAGQAALATIGTTAFSTYDTTDRVLQVIQTETPFVDTAQIYLDNSDKTFSSLNLRGERVHLGFGFDSEYSNVPDLYVAKQEDISIAGKLITRLECIGNWNRLLMHKVMGDAIGTAASTGTDKIKEIIEARLVSGMNLVIDTSDGEESIKVPNVIYDINTSRRQVVQEVIGLTQNLLKMRNGDMHMIKKNDSQQHRITGTLSATAFTAYEEVEQAVSGAKGKFIYQSVASGAGYMVIEAETGTFNTTNTITGASSGATLTTPTAIDAFDYLYGALAGDHTFFEFIRSQSMLQANRVIVVDALPDANGTNYAYSGTANDTADQATFGIVTMIFEDPSLASPAEATTAATSKLEHIKTEAMGGMLLAPMNCGQELYDYVQIDDDRAGFTSGSEEKLRISKIVRRYSPGEYTIELGFGGLIWERPANFDISDVISAKGEAEAAAEEVTPPTLPPGVIPSPPPPPGFMTIETANVGESRTRTLTPEEIHGAMPFVDPEDVRELKEAQAGRRARRREARIVQGLEEGEMTAEELAQRFPWLSARDIIKLRKAMRRR